ncbi:MAG: YraN family protein [Bacteroides sp.]
MWKKELGKQGEQAAVRFLEGQGMEIVARNWRYGRSELDLVAKQDEILHVVEVKTRWGDAYTTVEELIRRSQAQRILEGAQAFMEHYRGTATAIQVDLLVIITNPWGTSYEYIPDAIQDSF